MTFQIWWRGAWQQYRLAPPGLWDASHQALRALCLFSFIKWSQTCSLLAVGGTSLPQAQPRDSGTREIWEAWVILLNHWPGLKQMCFLAFICQETFVIACRGRWIKHLIFNWPLNQVTINACLLSSDTNLHLTSCLFWKSNEKFFLKILEGQIKYSFPEKK